MRLDPTTQLQFTLVRPIRTGPEEERVQSVSVSPGSDEGKHVIAFLKAALADAGPAGRIEVRLTHTLEDGRTDA